MINIITNSKIVEIEFANKCKAKGLEFRIIERVVELFTYFKEIKGSTVIVDCRNLMFKQIVDELIKSSEYMKEAIILCEDGCQEYEHNFKSSKMEDVFAVAVDRELKSVKYPSVGEVELERTARAVLENYEFSSKYEGYKYLKAICKNKTMKKETKFNCKQEMKNIGKELNLENCENIERNIRYIIQKNNNSEIAKIKGKGNAVSIKSVVMFLADKIEEALKI